MNSGPSGFHNAPVTRAFVIASAIFTIFFGLQGRSNKLGLAYQDVFRKLQFWKLIVSVFTFSSIPEAMFGLYLLYYFRIFERQTGSNKYSVFVLFSIIVSFSLEVLSLKLFRGPTLNFLPSGPYGLVFSSFVPFFFDIPVSTRFRVFGVQFSNKSFIYLAGFQLLLSSWKRSILPGIFGILAGSLYRLNVFHIRRMKFPEFVSSFFSRLSLPSAGSPSAPSPSRNAVRNLPSIAGPGRQVQGNYAPPTASAIEPPEDSIATLVSMGFDRDSGRQALVQSRNDLNAATNILLEAQSH